MKDREEINFNHLELDDFKDIDVDSLKYNWERFANVPNEEWAEIERSLSVVQDKTVPTTLRFFYLNHLPWIIVSILKSNETKGEEKYNSGNCIKCGFNLWLMDNDAGSAKEETRVCDKCRAKQQTPELKEGKKCGKCNGSGWCSVDPNGNNLGMKRCNCNPK